MVNDAKREYYTNEINNAAGDMSKIWKTLKELLPNKKGNLSTLPFISNTVSDLAENFNNHFINIVSLPDDISNSYNKCNNNRTEINCRFKFCEITVEQVTEEINDIPINKASGLDGVSTKLLKDAVNVIAPILCTIFNMSLLQGCFPDELKVARVTPIYKSCNKDDLSNYRPISILPLCSKMIEKIVHKQLYAYITENNLMYSNQSRFRKHHSTFPLVSLMTKIIGSIHFLATVHNMCQSTGPFPHQVLLSQEFPRDQF